MSVLKCMHDLNALLKQIRDGGIVVVYRCPHCQAPLKIGKDTKTESLRACEHCGSGIETVELADFLRTGSHNSIVACMHAWE